MQTTVMQEVAPLHKFEEAGLGVAPFRYVGSERRVGPIRVYDKHGQPTGEEFGAPGQPMGTCQYCGQGIAECCVIRDRDGKTFIVGNDCVAKTGDAGLVKPAKKARSASQLAAKHAKDKARIAAGRKMLEQEYTRVALAALPHPRITGKTMLDYVQWMFQNAGNAGKVSAVKLVEREQAGTTEGQR